jgi:hypothetical protein
MALSDRRFPLRPEHSLTDVDVWSPIENKWQLVLPCTLYIKLRILFKNGIDDTCWPLYLNRKARQPNLGRSSERRIIGKPTPPYPVSIFELVLLN